MDPPAITGTSKSKVVPSAGPAAPSGALSTDTVPSSMPVGLLVPCPCPATEGVADTPTEHTCLVLSSGGFLLAASARPLRREPLGGDGGGYDVPRCPGDSIRIPECLPEPATPGGTRSSDDGGTWWGDEPPAARFRLGSDWPSECPKTGTRMLRVFGLVVFAGPAPLDIALPATALLRGDNKLKHSTFRR